MRLQALVGKCTGECVKWTRIAKKNKDKVLDAVVFSLLALLIVLTSGFSATEFYFNNTVVGALHLGLFVFSFAVFFLRAHPRYWADLFKKKRFKELINLKTIIIVGILLLCLVSLLINVFRNDNLNGAIRALLIFGSAILLVFSIPFRKFAYAYCIGMTAICLLSLVIYPIALSISAGGATTFYRTGGGEIILSYGFLSSFIRYWNWSSSSELIARMCGPFWEPSIFGSLIAIAMAFLVVFKFKRRIVMLIPMLLCMLLTVSVGGYVLALFCVFLELSTRFRGEGKKRYIIVGVSLGGVALLAFLALGPLLPLLTHLLPSIFYKFANADSGSVMVRAKSFSIFMQVFMKSPLIGFGPNGALKQYEAILAITSKDISATSTFGYWMASLGIPGIFLIGLLFIAPIIFNRDHDKFTFGLFGVFLILIFNLENVRFVVGAMLPLMFFAKEGLFGPISMETSNVAWEYENTKAMLTKPGEDSRAARNLIGSLIVKVLAMLVGLFTVPVYNRFFQTNELYGAWSVIISILAWTLLLDFGFGGGLRVRLADALEQGDVEEQKRLVSSTYVGSIASSFVLLGIGSILIWSLDLSTLLNIDPVILSPIELKASMTTLLLGLCFEFVLKNICFVLYAAKKSALGSMITFLSHFAILVFFMVFNGVFKGSLFIAGAIIYALAVNFPLVLTTLIVFSLKKFKPMRPSLRYYTWEKCKSVMSFGIVFFIIQVGFVALANTNSVFISSAFGPAIAGDYSKYIKFFSAIIGLMGAVVQQPIWSAIATGISNKKYGQVKKYTKISLLIGLALFVLCCLCGLFLQPIFTLWLGSNSLKVNYLYVVMLIAYSFSFLVSDALIIVCNALKLLKVQAVITVIAAVVKIGISILIIQRPDLTGALGWSAFVLLDAVCYAPFIIITPLSIRRKVKEYERG
ncbi:MAG: hypothetical protein IJS37_00995 [Bacilli bacterium]|nr:hypothetical protein [Bacilli bacterium]